MRGVLADHLDEAKSIVSIVVAGEVSLEFDIVGCVVVLMVLVMMVVVGLGYDIEQVGHLCFKFFNKGF